MSAVIETRPQTLTYHAPSHTYAIDGVEVPSVTQVIKPLYSFDGIPPEVLDRKRDIGIATHEACALLDANNLDPDSLDPAIEGYVRAWATFKAEIGWGVLSVEQQVWHPAGFAGTYDVVMLKGDKRVLVDRKTTVAMDPAIGVQTAAYAKAYENTRGHQIQDRYGLQLKPDGRYVLHPYRDPADWSAFLSLLNIFQWRKKHDRRTR